MLILKIERLLSFSQLQDLLIKIEELFFVHLSQNLFGVFNVNTVISPHHHLLFLLVFDEQLINQIAVGFLSRVSLLRFVLLLKNVVCNKFEKFA
jgi:hypothetical protein